MVNKAKAKGTAGETKVVNYLTAHNISAQRRALNGNKDKGDIEFYPVSPSGKIIDAHVLEVKSGKQTHNYSRGLKEMWLEQTRVEAVNAGQPAYLVINVYNKNIRDAEVWSSDGRQFWYLDEFTKLMGGTFEEH